MNNRFVRNLLPRRLCSVHVTSKRAREDGGTHEQHQLHPFDRNFKPHLEAGAAHEETVDVWARRQLSGVGTLDGPAVDDAQGLVE